ncbi:hypothetical protein THAOC_23311 [Thalassiosira oceanica]|uniref:Uncharacterized protein n=1 Tax=Thalassiosira oceanica TaxID=159749 RepID=K0RSI2_THAOC|nr:hypothetical protein THAOC_23311 [Thalassiosira oceanica]|eukprot:EJK56743.1 hypothetical protein THAOC_23311 [Thalassiosira oceanica]
MTLKTTITIAGVDSRVLRAQRPPVWVEEPMLEEDTDPLWHDGLSPPQLAVLRPASSGSYDTASSSVPPTAVLPWGVQQRSIQPVTKGMGDYMLLLASGMAHWSLFC